MARKQKQEKIAKEFHGTKSSRDRNKSTATYCDQLNLPSTPHSLFDILFPLPFTSEHYSSSTNTDNSAAQNICSTQVMEQREGNEMSKDPAFESIALGESSSTVPALSSSFPHNWFETNNKEFLNAVQAASSQQMTSTISSETFEEKQIGTSGKMPADDSPSLVSFDEPLLPTVTKCPETSQMPSNVSPASTSAHTALASKLNKKRSSESKSANVFDDSDSDGSDDGSVSDDEELSINQQQFASKFLELRLQKMPCNFWQYNSQSRGPKGRRIYGEITLKDCHVLDEFTDPVSQNDDTSDNKQTTKLRHGEGNDPRPDVQKVLDIGARICRLEDEFRAITTTKPSIKEEAIREKNKLASRICRLKKKAQHEANKVKLEGLREEHQQLVAVIAKLVMEMERHCVAGDEMKPSSASVSNELHQPLLSSQLENLIQLHLKFMIAGHTSEYVNTQIEKAARFCISNRHST